MVYSTILIAQDHIPGASDNKNKYLCDVIGSPRIPSDNHTIICYQPVTNRQFRNSNKSPPKHTVHFRRVKLANSFTQTLQHGSERDRPCY